MKDKVAAKRYAQGLLAFAKESIGVEKCYEEYLGAVRILAENPGLKKILQNPEITRDEKFTAVDKVFGKDFSQEIREFLKLIIRKRRVEEACDIADYFEAFYYGEQGIEEGLITTARPLDDKTLFAIQRKLEIKLGKKLKLEIKIDRGLIGGIKARVGNKVIDGSVKSKLAQLKEHLMEIKVN